MFLLVLFVGTPQVDKCGLLVSLSCILLQVIFSSPHVFFSNHHYLLSHLVFTTPALVLVLRSSSALPAVPCKLFLTAFLLLHPVPFCFLSSHLFLFRAPETDGIPILLCRRATLCLPVKKQRVEGVVACMAVS